MVLKANYKCERHERMHSSEAAAVQYDKNVCELRTVIMKGDAGHTVPFPKPVLHAF